MCLLVLIILQHNPGEILREAQDSGIVVVSDLADLLGLTESHIQEGHLPEDDLQQYLAEEDTLKSFLSCPANHARLLVFTASDGRAEKISRFRTALLHGMTSACKPDEGRTHGDLFPNLVDVIWDPAVLTPASAALTRLSSAYDKSIHRNDRNKNMADLQAITDFLSLLPPSRLPRVHTRFSQWERPISHPAASRYVYPKMSYYGTVVRAPSVSLGSDLATASAPQLRQEGQGLDHIFHLSLAGHLRTEKAMPEIRKAVSQIAQRQSRIMSQTDVTSTTRISVNLPDRLLSTWLDEMRYMGGETQGYLRQGHEIILDDIGTEEATGFSRWYVGL